MSAVKLNILFVTIFLGVSVVALSQQNERIELDYDGFLDMVLDKHPMVAQADLQLERGDAAVLQARGAFDPKLNGDLAQKYFDDKTYYSLINGGVKIPTWFGIEGELGYEQNEGVFLNPENNLPQQGLWYAGISVPIGQGLVIDQRRTSLRKAQIFQQATEFERQLMLNDLLYDAGQTYWYWAESYQVLQIFENALGLAQQRLDAVKGAAEFGDAPAIDTLEAGIQVQNRLLSLQQARLDYNNARLAISVFLWLDGNVPLELTDITYPVILSELEPLNVFEGTVLLDSLLNNQPVLTIGQLKVDQLALEERWKRNQLLPELNLKYNPLSDVGQDFEDYSINNYKWGVEFAFPIFLRKERGALSLARIKTMESQLDLAQKRQMVQYKIGASINDWQTTYDQVVLYTQTTLDYERLLQGERTKFDIGESSLFLVNSREVKYIEAQVKVAELIAKNRKAEMAYFYAIGRLYQP